MGSLTKSFTKLESKGYLTKQQHKTDKRVYYIFATNKAIEVNDIHQQFHNKMVASIVQRLNQKSLICLADALESLTKFFNEV